MSEIITAKTLSLWYGENKALKDITQKEALILCDMVFNEMLTIVLLREHKKYEETYKNFNDKQKAAKTEKPTTNE